MEGAGAAGGAADCAVPYDQWLRRAHQQASDADATPRGVGSARVGGGGGGGDGTGGAVGALAGDRTERNLPLVTLFSEKELLEPYRSAQSIYWNHAGNAWYYILAPVRNYNSNEHQTNM